MEDSPKPTDPSNSKLTDSPVDTNHVGQEPDLPSLKPIPSRQDTPFYKRIPVSLSFIVLITAIYGLTSYPTDFQHPVDAAVILGGFYPPIVQAGEWWRYITATLLHGHPGHLFNNAMGILIFGNLLEPVIGPLRMIGLYVISAYAGLWFSYYMLPKGITYGASTIDYGLIGAYLTLILLMRYRYDRQTFYREFRGALFFVLLFIGWNTMESTTVNLWGHLGGLIGGVLFSIYLWKSRPRRSSPQI
jgi:membrane associated rhomboid family serine protease